MDVGIFHGASYVGAQLIELLLGHPKVSLKFVTSNTHATKPLYVAHPKLRGKTSLSFSKNDAVDTNIDLVFIAGGHGGSIALVASLLAQGYSGKIVDLSADFRMKDPSYYQTYFGFQHQESHLLESFVYGLAEVNETAIREASYIANPGCFATGIALALYPLSQWNIPQKACITACTGASGSGIVAKQGTHFPTREGNMKAYKVFEHQHEPEVLQVLGDKMELSWVSVSAPWTQGIWGTIQLQLPDGVSAVKVKEAYESNYKNKSCIRLYPNELPELLPVVNTPFCDIGWIIHKGHMVVAFAIDNIWKGAASQAIQNMNLLFGFPDGLGLLPITY